MEDLLDPQIRVAYEYMPTGIYGASDPTALVGNRLRAEDLENTPPFGRKDAAEPDPTNAGPACIFQLR